MESLWAVCFQYSILESFHSREGIANHNVITPEIESASTCVAKMTWLCSREQRPLDPAYLSNGRRRKLESWRQSSPVPSHTSKVMFSAKGFALLLSDWCSPFDWTFPTSVFQVHQQCVQTLLRIWWQQAALSKPTTFQDKTRRMVSRRQSTLKRRPR